jgi:hypothetical protein
LVERVAMAEPYPNVLFFQTPQAEDQTHWVVGQYKDLAKLETQLRYQEVLRNILTEHRVRIGLRNSDAPPARVARQERYGPTVPGEHRHTSFIAKRVNALAPPVRSDRPVPVNRRGDREQNVKDYWATQTPQAHHIVEFNNLETLGVSRASGAAEMDYQQLPAVLLAAEFHQRYLSSILKPAQKWEKAKLLGDIAPLYQGIYQGRSRLFVPLWDISKIILAHAGIKVG